MKCSTFSRATFSLSAIGLLTAGFAATESVARACSLEPCFAEHLEPATGTQVPATVPAFVQNWTAFAAAPPNAVLRDAAGVEIPTVAREVVAGQRWLSPTAPLAPGSYTLTAASASCTSSSTIVNTFEVGPAVPLPVEYGNVRVGPPQSRVITVADGAACTTDVLASVVSLSLEPTPAMKAFEAVTKYKLTVDGEEWVRTPYGNRRQEVPGSTWRGVDEIYSLCDDGRPGAESRTGVGPGKHHAELTAEIAGGESLPPVAFDFEIGCPQDPPPACASGGGGAALSPVPLAWLLYAGFLRWWRRRDQRV